MHRTINVAKIIDGKKKAITTIVLKIGSYRLVRSVQPETNHSPGPVPMKNPIVLLWGQL